MDIKFNIDNNILYVKLIGELDEYTSSYARNILDELFLNNTFKAVVFELSNLEFMDSTGIGVLIGRYKKLQLRNIPIYIINPSRQAEKIFQMSGLYDIMPKIS